MLTNEDYKTICEHFHTRTVEVFKQGDSVRYRIRKNYPEVKVEAPIGFRLLCVTVDCKELEPESCKGCALYMEGESWKIPVTTILIEKVS